jgi:hypothetical protein
MTEMDALPDLMPYSLTNIEVALAGAPPTSATVGLGLTRWS